MERCICYLILFLNPLSTIAQSESLPEVRIKNTEVRIIKSSIVENTSYEIHISLPGNYSETNENYPVLYYLDAYHWGGIVIETYRLLRAFKEVKPLILVGISYKDASMEEEYFYRSRDLIPTIITEKNRGSYSASIPPASGGSDKFFKFIEEELKPLVSEHYRVDVTDSGILGISNGALFATYVLFNKPDAFKNYILGSPRYDRDNFSAIEYESEYFAKSQSLPVNLFLSKGSEEPEFIISSWTKLRNILQSRNYEELKLITKTFEGENHTSGIPGTISRGIRELYKSN